MKEIKVLATKFRKALEKAKDDRVFIYMDDLFNFPAGCCGTTSELLAEFLKINGITTEYFCGEVNCDNQTHAWLIAREKIIIDITGDQFKYNVYLDNYNVKVYVGYQDLFHSRFAECNRYTFKSMGLDLSNINKTIIEYID